MRVRATLTTLTATAAALAVLAPVAPAQAVPTPVGEWVTATPRVVRTVVPDECRDVVQHTVAVDLQGVGNAIAAQGYYDRDGDPVYTNLSWDVDYRVTGPANFYDTRTDGNNSFPTGEQTYTFQVCPDDFSAGVVTAGTYTVETHVVVHNSSFSGFICSAAEGCRNYPKLYERTLTSTFALAAEAAPAPSAECVAATSQVKRLAAKLTKAKAALKRAKASHQRPLIRKKKQAVRRLKGKLGTARAAVDRLC